MSNQVEQQITHATDYIHDAEVNSSGPDPTEMLRAGQIRALCAIAHAIDRLADAVSEQRGQRVPADLPESHSGNSRRW